MNQEHQFGSPKNCIGELQQQAYAQRLELQDAQHGNIESRREQARLQEELSMKEKLLLDTQIRKIHEMGEMKRAQEQRVDEVSVPKLRESHDTIQRPTSQLQSMQEQMNSMNDSGEFQEVDSNHSGRLFRFPSQPEAIPSSSSMLSRDKSVPFSDAWDSLGLQENVFGNQFSTYGSPGNHSQGIHYGVSHKTPRETESVPRAIGTSFAGDDEQNKGTNPMPMFATRPSTMSSLILVEIPQNPIIGQQRHQISLRHIPNSTFILMVEDTIQESSDYLF